MSNEKTGVIEYSKLRAIRLKSGFIITRRRDPSEDLDAEIRHFCSQQRQRFNSIVASTFELPDDGFTKFEFIWTPKRARIINGGADYIASTKVAFRSEADVTLLYLKDRSLILFNTKYRFAITEPGCGGNGSILYTGGTNFTLEEIYFNKITTVGAYHNEEIYRVVSPGCGGGTETNYTVMKDGFVIRAGESFRIIASEDASDELRDARQLINQKISTSN